MLTNKILKSRATKPTAGFTTIELLIVIIVLGIVSAIAAPSWLYFINNQRLKVSIDRVNSAMVTARSNAKRDKTAWQASFKQVGETVQVAVHKSEIPPAQVPAGEWKSLEHQIQINRNDTTLLPINDQNEHKQNGTIRRAMFNFQGCPVYKISDECGLTNYRAKGNLTLSHPNLKNSDRCVIISTILGHKRTSQRQRKPNQDGRYCY
ncbi:MAG: prepilin-type N-terminal cleavage/methylation domain-containing protein [Microcoleus sp. SU_5_3]|nr:prepilin-type N-terminal cleavage/methylation domain-containing protein [Microcoleus sp. SU_5_3]